MRIGQGFDAHALVAGRKLIIGGVEIPHAKGLEGHSDADVLIHAVCDALLGAAGLGDIGTHFPDSDPRYQDIDSRKLLREVARLLKERGLKPANVDATIIAQAPRLALVGKAWIDLAEGDRDGLHLPVAHDQDRRLRLGADDGLQGQQQRAPADLQDELDPGVHPGLQELFPVGDIHLHAHGAGAGIERVHHALDRAREGPIRVGVADEPDGVAEPVAHRLQRCLVPEHVHRAVLQPQVPPVPVPRDHRLVARGWCTRTTSRTHRARAQTSGTTTRRRKAGTSTAWGR